MPNEQLVYFSPELMAFLFFGSLFVGLIIGYFLWGQNRQRLETMNQENSELLLRLDKLSKDKVSLEQQLDQVSS